MPQMSPINWIIMLSIFLMATHASMFKIYFIPPFNPIDLNHTHQYISQPFITWTW